MPDYSKWVVHFCSQEHIITPMVQYYLHASNSLVAIIAASNAFTILLEVVALWIGLGCITNVIATNIQVKNSTAFLCPCYGSIRWGVSSWSAAGLIMTTYSCYAIKSLAHLTFCYFNSTVGSLLELIFNSISSSTFGSNHHSVQPYLDLNVHFRLLNRAWLFFFQDYSHSTTVAIGNYSILFDVNSKIASYACLELSC